MDCHDLPPRLAFGHLDQDGFLKEDMLTVDLVEAATPGEQEPAQHTKSQTALACSVPESDQVLPVNRRHVGSRRRLE